MPRFFKCGRFQLELGHRTLVMGIVNVTPDSFSDGGETSTVDQAIDRALRHIDSGADIIDIGGESSRPGSLPVTLEEEIRRVIPVIEALAPQAEVPISVDTYKSAVALEAIKAGASIINDISAGTFDQKMPHVVAKAGAGVVIMHIKGTPRDMQMNPTYIDVVEEVKEFLEASASKFNSAGVMSENILVDPGIGFGKNLEHNLKLISNLSALDGIGAGILYGPSRKSFIGALTGQSVHDRLAGTIGAVIAGSYLGADIIRVHDVGETVDALKVADAVRGISGNTAVARR